MFEEVRETLAELTLGTRRFHGNRRGAGLAYAIIGLLALVAIIVVFLLAPFLFIAVLAIGAGLLLTLFGPGLVKVLGVIVLILGIILAILALFVGTLVL